MNHTRTPTTCNPFPIYRAIRMQHDRSSETSCGDYVPLPKLVCTALYVLVIFTLSDITSLFTKYGLKWRIESGVQDICLGVIHWEWLVTISLVWWFDMKIMTRRVQICFENMIVDQEARRGVQGRAGNYEYECRSKYADIIIFIFITLIQRSPVVLVLSVTYLVFNLYFPTFFFSTWTWAPHLTIHRNNAWIRDYHSGASEEEHGG